MADRRDSNDRRHGSGFRPRAGRSAAGLLARIGRPDDTPFRPDPFQTEAVDLVARHDVLVSAPTGSGKTWIAVQAMEEAHARGGRAWYASPLKALSNAKHIEFGEHFGQGNVGILTGDRKENPDAPVVVGTTEILRNQLYDAMYSGEDMARDLVILDEAHYLGDPDRGTVWEEVIIYLPPRVRLLLLSATIGNADELAAWLLMVRGRDCRVVRSEERPVPLSALYLNMDGRFEALKRRGGLNPLIEHQLQRPGGLRRGIYLDKILAAAQEMNLLPAIFFLPSRADCDQALAFCRNAPLGDWAARMDDLNRQIDDFLDLYPFLAGHQLLGPLRRSAAASHHAGHLPHFKLLVEKLMQAGLLRAVFATSTIAAGVNFPARSVVLPQSDRYNGRHFVDLTASELAQMTGRAGRRGMDRAGFVILPPGPHQNLPLVADLLDAPPDDIRSRMSLNFSMVLNLLQSHSPNEIEPLLGLSLAAFQTAERADDGRPRFYDELNRTLVEKGCGGVEQAIVNRRRHSRAASELARLETDWNSMVERLRLDSLLVPGRIVIDDRSRPWLVRKKKNRRSGEGHHRPGILATRISPQLKLKRGRLRMKFLGLDRLKMITDRVMEPVSDKQLLQPLRRLSEESFIAAPEPKELSGPARAELEQAQRRLDELRRTTAESGCLTCPLSGGCLGSGDPRLRGRLSKAGIWLDGLARQKQLLWMGFVERLEFLKAEGFVRADGRPTETGHWASDLRLDHPLIITRAIEAGALPDTAPPLLAGLMAPFVLDRDRAFSPASDRYKAPGRLTAAFRRMQIEVEPLIERQKEAGFRSPRLRFAPALAVWLWASGRKWDELTDMFDIQPGDLAALMLRTADNLRQLASLGRTFPQLADTARKARKSLLREPVLVPDQPMPTQRGD